MSDITIAVDVMGGDHGHLPIIAGAVQALNKISDILIILVGDESAINQALDSVPESLRTRISVVASTQVVAMTESPRSAVRHMRDSSMRLALEQVKKGEAQACMSCGNTGALVAMSKYVLKTVKGIKRPAILSPIPSLNGISVMLDLGANTVCTPENLFQFAVMGNTVARFDYGIENPRVGLLNIGTEAGKGTQELKDADQLLVASDLNYVGFVEGNHIFTDAVDVVVSDGFTGNIALKTMEGFAEFFTAHIKKAASIDNESGIGHEIINAIDPRSHNGATLVGLNGIVIKSHGSADEIAVRYAIEMAAEEAHSHLPQRVAKSILELTKGSGVASV